MNLPNCEVCGKFINPLKVDHICHYVYGWMEIDREAFYHPDCFKKSAIIDRTFADTIKVTFRDGYTQKFWVDETDEQVINRCFIMREQGIKSL